MPTGNGFLSGYGLIARSAYATSIDLGFKNIALDFAPDGLGLPFPTEFRTNPYATDPYLEWRTEDWDPGLRFWDLRFDPQLTEWLQDLDMASLAVQAAREFARDPALWQLSDGQLVTDHWLEPNDLAWRPPPFATATPAEKQAAWNVIGAELDELVDLMEDDRERYLAEALEQADAIPRYFAHLMGIDRSIKPWTSLLIQAGLGIGNLVYLHYKSVYRRVRPSYLCRGLLPPFGPPAHPAFPSGHSFLGHFITLLLLQLDGVVAARFGIGMTTNGGAGRKPTWSEYNGTANPPVAMTGRCSGWPDASPAIVSAWACTIRRTAAAAAIWPVGCGTRFSATKRSPLRRST